MTSLDKIWCEKYRPQTVDDLMVDDDAKALLHEFAKSGQIPNLLFAGSPGTGKTSTSKIIVKDILKCNYLYINASDENGIDMIRNKVSNFSQTKSFDGKVKVVILDECLHEDTLVTVLVDGEIMQIPIKDLDQENHLVKTFNIIHNRVEYRPFTKWDMGEQDVYEIEFENGEAIICTDSHKWYVKDSNGDICRKKLIDIINENITEIITKVDSIN